MLPRGSWLIIGGFVMALAAGSPTEAASPWLGQWIWHPGDDVKTAVFRKTFDVRRTPAEARIALTADDRYAFYLNGKLVDESDRWQSIEVYNVEQYLRIGRNVIAVRATNDGGHAGLLVEGSVTYGPTEFTPILSDETWKVEHREAPGWADPGTDDSAWANAKVIARPPGGPWGEIFHPQTLPALFAPIEHL
ncbi:hypothetical protein AMK68_03540, partial [candidate division KD3-62 bacterium DG_56]